MKMSLRKILEDAGRYDDVTKILEDIVKNIHNGMYCCNNKIKWRVNYVKT